MPNTPPVLISGGDVRPARFVKMDTSEQVQALEANANETVIGISRDETKFAPLSDLTVSANAAEDGDAIPMLGDGEIGILTAGAAVTSGNYLKSDNDGKGVPIATTGTTLQRYGAVALEDAAADGDKIRVQVQIGSERPALS
jgi:hypothetical protein